MNKPEVFRSVLLHQANQHLHPLTCGKCPTPERDDFPLVPWVRDGKVILVCPLGCGYEQNWIPTLP